MSNVMEWRPIGNVVGNTSTYEFMFILKSFRSRLGDIVAARMHIPTDDYSDTEDVYVWGRITSIDRYNPFFPYESAVELADSGLRLEDTVLSSARDQLQATVLVLGYTRHSDIDKFELFPVTYPIAPGIPVLFPPALAIEKFLSGNSKMERRLGIGKLIARSDVEVSIRANPVVGRHMAILAMTGGGKTVAARRMIRELAAQRYPLLILDPHGDYLGLWEKRNSIEGVKNVRLFFPYVRMSEQAHALLNSLIARMTVGLTEPQQAALGDALAKISISKQGEKVQDYIERLLPIISKLEGKHGEPTKNAVRRSLGLVRTRLEKMEKANTLLRKHLEQFHFEELPDTFDRPEEIIAPSQISILYLGGYDHLTQSTIVSILLDNLFDHRAAMTDRIPPFLTVVEEAHNFIPSSREGTADTPSLESIRRIITEGRKFGTGLLLISQRPSRLDDTILSQCNSFLILRLVNPRDQTFVKQVMENLSESDARLLPGFGPGQGIVSGQSVRFPILVKIRRDQDLEVSVIGDENFIENAEGWRPDASYKKRTIGLQLERKLTRGGEKNQPRFDSQTVSEENPSDATRKSILEELGNKVLKDAAEQVLNRKQRFNVSWIKKTSGISTENARKIIAFLLKKGVIRMDGKKGNRNLYKVITFGP